MIEKNIHIINDTNDTNDFLFVNYLTLLSIINIVKPDSILYYYFKKPNNNLWNSFYKIYSNKITLIEINMPIHIYKKYKLSFILSKLYETGGIYIENNIFFINPIDILFNNYMNIKTNNNSIIGTCFNSNIANKYYKLFLNKVWTIDDFNNDNNITQIEYLYNNTDENTTNIVNKKIFDYTFGEYFHIIKNCYFISINDCQLHYPNIFTEVTIFNLLIRYILTYKYYNKIVDINNNKLNYINNIDIIYYINLEKSFDRYYKMENLLENVNIKRKRIVAIDGEIEENIHSRYFLLNDIDNEYPKYSNKEYAILLSHLNTIEKFVLLEDNLTYNICMICEDDLSFDFISYWKNDFKTIIENAPNDWDILMLGYFSLNINRKEEYSKWDNEWSAISYLVNRNNIKPKILDRKIENKWKCNSNDLIVSDNYIFSKFNTYVYKYPYFTFPNDNDSTLHNDHINYHKIYKISNYMILEDLTNLEI